MATGDILFDIEIPENAIQPEGMGIYTHVCIECKEDFECYFKTTLVCGACESHRGTKWH